MVSLVNHSPHKTNLPSFRPDAASHTQGISNSIYRAWSKKLDAFSCFQHALIVGTVRLLPTP